MNDDNLILNYIQAIENPTNEGLSNGIWRRPTKPGFDQNQLGVGLDIYKNHELNQFLKDNNRLNNPWLTIDEEKQFRLSKIHNDLDEVWNRRTRLSKLSPIKKTIAYGLMYHGYGPKLWKQSELYNSFWNGSDKDFIDTVTKFYNGKYSERSKAHQQFWNNYMKDNSFNINQYTQPINTDKPPYKNKTLQDYMTIQTHKQGGNMKVKNQTTTRSKKPLET